MKWVYLVLLTVVTCSCATSEVRTDHVTTTVRINFVSWEVLEQKCWKWPGKPACYIGSEVWIHDLGKYGEYSGTYPVDIQFMSWDEQGRQCGISLLDLAPCELAGGTIAYVLLPYPLAGPEQVAGEILMRQWGLPAEGVNVNRLVGHEVLHAVGWEHPNRDEYKEPD